MKYWLEMYQSGNLQEKIFQDIIQIVCEEIIGQKQSRLFFFYKVEAFRYDSDFLCSRHQISMKVARLTVILS